MSKTLWIWELPWWLSGKEFACQRGRHGFDPWSGKIPHSAEHEAHAPQLLSKCPRDCAPQREEPPQWEAQALQLDGSPRRSQLEKRPHSNKDPAQSEGEQKQETTDRGLNQQTFISHRPRGCEIQDQGTSKLDVWWWPASPFSLCPHMENGQRNPLGCSFRRD